MASAIEIPTMTDECASKKLRITYARLLNELDITTELKESIYICDPQGNRLLQKVEYEWRLAFCKKCNRVGHNCEKHRTNKPPLTQRLIEKPLEVNKKENNII